MKKFILLTFTFFISISTSLAQPFHLSPFSEYTPRYLRGETLLQISRKQKAAIDTISLSIKANKLWIIDGNEWESWNLNGQKIFQLVEYLKLRLQNYSFVSEYPDVDCKYLEEFNQTKLDDDAIIIKSKKINTNINFDGGIMFTSNPFNEKNNNTIFNNTGIEVNLKAYQKLFESGLNLRARLGFHTNQYANFDSLASTQIQVPVTSSDAFVFTWQLEYVPFSYELSEASVWIEFNGQWNSAPYFDYRIRFEKWFGDLSQFDSLSIVNANNKLNSITPIFTVIAGIQFLYEKEKEYRLYGNIGPGLYIRKWYNRIINIRDKAIAVDGSTITYWILRMAMGLRLEDMFDVNAEILFNYDDETAIARMSISKSFSIVN